MSSKDRALHEAPRPKRASIFWWSLAHLLVISFAVTSWVSCLYIFNYPEKPENYEILRKLGRLPAVTSFDPLSAPEGNPANPKTLYKKFFPQDPEALDGLNLQFRRGYIRNYHRSDPRFTIYIEGDFLVESVAPLETQDFFHPGLRVRAQALVRPDELSEPAPYPVWIDLLLPTAAPPSGDLMPIGEPLSLEHINHRIAILHAAKTTLADEPAVLVTAVPLAYKNIKSTAGRTLPLAPPGALNLEATFTPPVNSGS